MQTALEHLSKEDLLKVISSRDAALSEQQRMVDSLSKECDTLSRERDYLKAQVEMLRRMQFGQKRERFEGDPNQTALPFEAEPVEVQQQQEETKQKIEYVRRRPNHKGRAKLPEHLPVQEIEIHPQGDLSDMVCIGKDISRRTGMPFTKSSGRKRRLPTWLAGHMHEENLSGRWTMTELGRKRHCC